jgi:hypothetical protein
MWIFINENEPHGQQLLSKCEYKKNENVPDAGWLLDLYQEPPKGILKEEKFSYLFHKKNFLRFPHFFRRSQSNRFFFTILFFWILLGLKA